MSRRVSILLLVMALFGPAPFGCGAGSEDLSGLEAANERIAQLFEEGKQQEAIPLAEKALALARRTRGPDDLDTATCLDNLAILYEAINENGKAEPLLQEALRIRRKVLGNHHPETAASLNALAVLYERMGAYDKAEPLLQEAVRINRETLGDEDPQTATSISNLAELYDTLGDYAKAEPLLQEALRIRKKVLGDRHPDTATSLTLLGRLYEALGQDARAEPFLAEALKVRREALGNEHPDTASSMVLLGRLYEALGDYARAEPLLEEALQVRRKLYGDEHPDTAASLESLALLYQATGEYARAEPLFQKALRVRRKVFGNEHHDTAASLNNLGELYEAMGEYDKAEPLLQQALQIGRKILGDEHPDTATSLSNLAALYSEMGDYGKAEPLFEEALRIRRKVLGDRHRDTADSLNNLAELYRALGDYTRAEPLLQEALQIRRTILGDRHPDTATSLNNLAGLYFAMADYAKAEPLFEEALQICRKVFPAEHPDLAQSLNNLAELYRALGDYAKAEPLLQEGLRIDKALFGADHPDTVTILTNLAVLQFDLGHPEKAKALARDAAEAQRGLLGKMFSFTSEQQRLAYLGTFHPYDLWALLPGCEADLALALLRYKGVVLDSIIEDRLLAQASADSQEQERVERLNADRRQLDQLLLQAPRQLTEANSQRLSGLEAEVEQLEGQLAQRLTGLGQARRALGVTLEQVQARLLPQAGLVEYLRYGCYLGQGRFEPWYGALVLPAQGPPRWVPLAKAAQVDKLVRRYSALAARGGHDDDEELAANLAALYSAVWAPVEQQLPEGTRRLVISPDGQLNFVSLGTLLTPQGQFLAERFSLQYAVSGRDLLREVPPPATHRVVLFADPDFENAAAAGRLDRGGEQQPAATAPEAPQRWRGTERRGLEGVRFEPLAGTFAESRQLRRLFESWHWPTEVRTASQATKAELLALHSPYLLHLATHGFFEPQRPAKDQGDSLEGLPQGAGAFQSKFFANPMHQSGLALTGANATLRRWARGKEAPALGNDGILTAEDVSALDLRSTWLVTLSACDTAQGQAKAGEGVMGLRRGFVQAGAQNLLMTLWSISDETTVALMSDFYEAAHRSGDAPQALADVQRRWLVKLRKDQGLAQAITLAGPFIMSAQGRPE